MNNSGEEKPKQKRRSVTSLTLGWIADRLRRAEKIKEQLHRGTYKVDSEQIARSIVSKE